MDGIRDCGTIPSYRRRTYQIKLHLYGVYPLVNATRRQISFLLLSFNYMKMSIRRPWGYAVFILYGARGADTKGAFQ